MSILFDSFADNLAKKRMEKAKEEFELLKKPTSYFNKLELVQSFMQKGNQKNRI